MKSVRELARNDKEMLQRVLDHFDDLSDLEQKVFSSMLHKIKEAEKKDIPKMLTFQQSSWLNAVAKRLDVVEPAANLVSRGLVPRGNEIPVPPVLMNRPHKPPGRH